MGCGVLATNNESCADGKQAIDDDSNRLATNGSIDLLSEPISRYFVCLGIAFSTIAKSRVCWS